MNLQRPNNLEIYQASSRFQKNAPHLHYNPTIYIYIHIYIYILIHIHIRIYIYIHI